MKKIEKNLNIISDAESDRMQQLLEAAWKETGDKSIFEILQIITQPTKSEKMLHVRGKQPEIELCKDCNGIGYRFVNGEYDWYSRAHETIKENCPTCSGTGRVVVTKKTLVSVLPYDVEKAPN